MWYFLWSAADSSYQALLLHYLTTTWQLSLVIPRILTHRYDHSIGQFIPLLLLWEVYAYCLFNTNTQLKNLINTINFIQQVNFLYLLQLDIKSSSGYSNIYTLRKCYCGLRMPCQTETCSCICYKTLICLTSWWFFLTNNIHRCNKTDGCPILRW